MSNKKLNKILDIPYANIMEMILDAQTGEIKATIDDRRKDPTNKNMDDLVERFRICPECGKEFFTHNTNCVFCCEEHKKNFNNRDDRSWKLEKPASPINSTEVNELATTLALAQATEIKKTIIFLEGLSTAWPQKKPIRLFRTNDIDLSICEEMHPILHHPESFALKYGPFFICQLSPELLLINKKQKP